MDSGAPSVTVVGTYMMPVLCAGHWDTDQQNLPPSVPIMEEEWAQSSLQTSSEFLRCYHMPVW